MKTLSKQILAYAISYQGQWHRIAKALKNQEPYQEVPCPYPYVTIGDANFPLSFRKLRYPPFILFYQGNLALLEKASIGIVGARKCSNQALVNTQRIVEVLKDKYCIVSGLAKGIDGQAHHCAKDTIGFIGCGIDQIYPKCNADLYHTMAKEQLIMSEYPMGTAPLAHHFPWRNRLIAASSDALIVIESTYKSGTMLTVNECIELSKPVYCLPTAFENDRYPGCNALIESGANILCDIHEVEKIF